MRAIQCQCKHIPKTKQKGWTVLENEMFLVFILWFVIAPIPFFSLLFSSCHWEKKEKKKTINGGGGETEMENVCFLLWKLKHFSSGGNFLVQIIQFFSKQCGFPANTFLFKPRALLAAGSCETNLLAYGSGSFLGHLSWVQAACREKGQVLTIPAEVNGLSALQKILPRPEQCSHDWCTHPSTLLHITGIACPILHLILW